MCFLCGIFERNCVTDKSHTCEQNWHHNPIFHNAKNRTHISTYCVFLLCVGEKHFNAVWQAIVQPITFPTPPPPPKHPASPVCSMHAITVLHLKKKGGGGKEWRTGKVTKGLRDKNQADFYLGRAPGAGSSRILLPSNQEKRDEGCNVAAGMDSRHNLFLSALAQRIVLHRSSRCFSKRLPATFHAITLGNHIFKTMLSHYFRNDLIAVWADMSSLSGSSQMGCISVPQGVFLHLPMGVWEDCGMQLNKCGKKYKFKFDLKK